MRNDNLNNYCTEFMILVVMVCTTLLSTEWCLITLNFPLVFKISLLFVEIYEVNSQLKPVFINFTERSLTPIASRCCSYVALDVESKASKKQNKLKLNNCLLHRIYLKWKH